MPSRPPSNGLERANQNETFQLGPWALGFVFILFFSSVRRSTFHVARNFFRNVNELRRTWIVASGLEDSAKTPPGYDRITIFAQAAQATDIEQAKLRHLPLCLFRDEVPPLPEIEP